MSTITSLGASDNGAVSRTTINNNFTNLNTDKIETSVLDTDTTLAANSDSKIPTQKAVKAYVDAGGNVNASTTTKGIVEEATQAEVNAGTASGGTGARLFVNPSTLAGYLSNSNVISKIACGSTSYDLSNATGTQTIAHGLGVTPKMVRIRAVYSNEAVASSSAFMSTAETVFTSSQASTFSIISSASSASANNSKHGNTFAVYSSLNTDRYQTGVVTTDATNISISWTKTSTPTGTAYLMWEALA